MDVYHPEAAFLGHERSVSVFLYGAFYDLFRHFLDLASVEIRVVDRTVDDVGRAGITVSSGSSVGQFGDTYSTVSGNGVGEERESVNGGGIVHLDLVLCSLAVEGIDYALAYSDRRRSAHGLSAVILGRGRHESTVHERVSQTGR